MADTGAALDSAANSGAAVADAPTPAAPATAAVRTSRRTIALIAAVALALAAVVGAVALYGGGSNTVRVVIPPGAGNTLDRGADPKVVGTEIVLRAGQSLVVENRDDRLHRVADVVVAPGSTARHLYETKGRFPGPCDLRADRTVTIVVR